MNKQLLELQNKYRQKSTDELLEIWKTNDITQYTEEAFAAIKTVLSERLQELPLQNSPVTKKEIFTISTSRYMAEYLVSFSLGLLLIPIKGYDFPKFIIGLFPTIVLLSLVYNMWKAIPPKFARTTPGKAVGFLFIPFFNIYWFFFVAFVGWAKDWNTYSVASQGKLQKVSVGLSIWIVVLWFSFATIMLAASIIMAFNREYFVETVTFLTLVNPNIILIPIFIYGVCKRINQAAEVLDSTPACSAPIP